MKLDIRNILFFFFLHCLLSAACCLFSPLSSYSQPNDGLPEDFPEISVTYSDNPSPGYIFISPLAYVNWYPDAVPYLIIMDNYGTPVFYRKTTNRFYDLKVQPNGCLSYFETISPASRFQFYIANEKYQVIDSAKTIGFWPDAHEFQLIDGHYFVMGDDYHIVNMDTVVPGGHPNALVQGLVIQELDSMKEVVFQWRAIDHFEITDANDHINLTDSVIDWVHGNAIEIDTDTTMLISCRNMDEITKIDRRTGDIIWRLGGKKNQFEFINDDRGFSWQHDIRRLPNGNITLHDNGVFHEDPYSSGVEYELDEVNKTVTLFHRYRNTPDIFGSAMGNSQKLSNGGMLVGWGTISPNVTEFHPNGDIALIIEFTAVSYRAFKFNWETTVFDLDKDSIDFGNIYSADSILSVLTLTNNMDETLEITGYHHHHDQFLIIDSFPFTIPSFSAYDLTIKFKPEIPGNYQDIFTINSDINSESLVQRISRQVYLTGGFHDTIPPSVTIYPSDGAGDISLDTIVTLHFDEPVIKADGDTINNSDIPDMVIFKETDISGNDVGYSAFIDTNKTEITISPDSLNYFQKYYIELIANTISDTNGNVITTAQTSTFITLNNFDIQEPVISDIIDFFPNPNNGIFKFEFDVNSSKNIQIFDILGNLVYSNEVDNEKMVEIDFSDQPDGLYFIEIFDRGISQHYCGKIVKQ